MEKPVVIDREAAPEIGVTRGLCKNLDLLLVPISFFHGGKG
jgi:hypothetical protein